MTTKKGQSDKAPTPKAPTRKKSSATGKRKPVPEKMPPPAPPKNQLPIVGIGASAGGMGAFEKFFNMMPEDSGIAFVLVSHLDPHHASILPDILQRKTGMKVSQVSDNMEVLPNQVVIIPPNKEMAILNGRLQLLDLHRPRGSYLPIDIFFRTLAQDQGSNAIGIVLSGTGTDGTLGIRAIKGEAGMVMVQDLDSAQYDGMPRSAIATGLVDYILPPEKMPEQLIKYVRHQGHKLEAEIVIDDGEMPKILQKIFLLLRSATGHDFSMYKTTTIFRRIERRMHVHQVDKIADYVRYLQESDQEVTVLFKELLIGVTNFFRDPKAFAVLQQKYLPALFKDKPDDYQVRIWVAGCSSGEEAFSIAIIVQECMYALGRHFEVQIFATDLDEEAISVARAGLYPESIAVDVSPERLKKFFNKTETHYRVRSSIRDMVVFARQDIIKDPPFTKLDLLCCRNLLIYFAPELQKKILPIFHYSLKQGGILFLGSSESISQSMDLFNVLDKKWKLFECRPSEMAFRPVLGFSPPPSGMAMAEKEVPAALNPLKDVNAVKLLQAVLAQSDMPTSVVIDDSANIVYIHGRTGRYLEPAEGEVSINILDMARPGLKAGLLAAIRKMAAERQQVMIEGVQVKMDGGVVEVNLIVRPLPDFQTGHRGLMMVVFDEISHQKGGKVVKTTKAAQATKSTEVKRLEDELQYTRENLQTTIEELETSNEELKSTNEELQSTNEELQSTNEEMETSKEELQSLNEESNTVNSELQGRIDELVEVNDDIKNLLDAIEIATLFLDIDLNVRRFTAKITNIFPLTLKDLGRPLRHFTSSLQGVDLHSHAEKVLHDLEKDELEVIDNVGTIFRMRIKPYRTVNNVIGGVVVTFEDITQLKGLLNQAKRLAAIVRDSNDAITMLDFNTGKIMAWNRGAAKTYGYSEAEALKMNIMDLVPRPRQPEAKALLARLKKNEELVPYVTERLTKKGEIVNVWLTVTILMDENDCPAFIATTERDLSLFKGELLQKMTGGENAKV